MEGGVLRVEAVSVTFGGVKALDHVTLTLAITEILGLIGPNGAGKTTLVNVISGFQRPNDGTVLVGDTDVTGWAPARRAQIGLTRTWQSVRPFAGLTVADNVIVGALATGKSTASAQRHADEILNLMALTGVREWPAARLPHGLLRRLGVARALALTPRFVLLDEPAAGLDDFETDGLTSILRQVHEQFGCGLLLIEHDVPMVMDLCHRVLVLDHGACLFEGTPTAAAASPVVREAYFGADAVLGNA